MVVEINLLPKEKAVSKTAQRATIVLNKIALGLTVLFLIITVAGGSIYFLISRNLSTMRDEQETFTTNIESLQGTESSLILLKDRIQKAQNILANKASEDAFKKQQSVLSFNTGGISFESSEIDTDRSQLEIAVGNSRDLLSLFSNLLIQNNFSSLVISELAFVPGQGYLVELDVN